VAGSAGESEQRRRAEKFKELIKQGLSVNRALKESKLHPRYYKQHYEEIWGDPELEPYRHKAKKLAAERASQRSEGPLSTEEPPTIEETEKRLAQYGLVPGYQYRGEFEKAIDEFALELESLRRAVEKASRLFKSLGAPSPQAPPAPAGRAEGPKDVIEQLETALRDFESKRAKLKEVLEKMGFKVEDLYMRRDEVERLIEEERRKAFEEALEDKRIKAVENIINNAISRLIELFRPAVQAFFTSAPTPATSEALVPVAASSERKVTEAGATE